MSMHGISTPTLDRVTGPADLKALSDAELSRLADELRRETIEVVSRTGGHLGSSLGVVELTVAIHAVFNTPLDKLIWDVGHQCYPHKILTGRRDRMLTLRQAGPVGVHQAGGVGVRPLWRGPFQHVDQRRLGLCRGARDGDAGGRHDRGHRRWRHHRRHGL